MGTSADRKGLFDAEIHLDSAVNALDAFDALLRDYQDATPLPAEGLRVLLYAVRVEVATGLLFMREYEPPSAP